MRPRIPQTKHNVCQGVWRDGLSGPSATDLTVLTENALQIATAKKDGSRSSRSAEEGLLPRVQSGTSHQKLPGNAAKADVSVAAVDFAVSRTLRANFHLLPPKTLIDYHYTPKQVKMQVFFSIL
jgi:hypothetical protein